MNESARFFARLVDDVTHSANRHGSYKSIPERPPGTGFRKLLRTYIARTPLPSPPGMHSRLSRCSIRHTCYFTSSEINSDCRFEACSVTIVLPRCDFSSSEREEDTYMRISPRLFRADAIRKFFKVLIKMISREKTIVVQKRIFFYNTEFIKFNITWQNLQRVQRCRLFFFIYFAMCIVQYLILLIQKIWTIL